jgi:hypothetical protein
MSYELDKRQRALIKLCREVGRPGEAKLDLVMQSANFAGLSTALRSEERFSTGETCNSRAPATCLIETGKRSLYIGMQDAARRFGSASHSYLEGIRNLVHVLSKTRGAKRPVCIALDHAGAVPVERLETVFRAADDCAYRNDIPLHVIVVITKIHAYDFKLRSIVAVWPKENELLKPRWRTFEYGPKSFNFVKAAMKFEPVVGDDASLLDECDRPTAMIA